MRLVARALLACALWGCDGDTAAPTKAEDAGGPVDAVLDGAIAPRDAAEPKDGRGDDADSSRDEPDASADATTPSNPCDLTGSWLVTLRQRINALGAQQVSRGWHHLEISQQGDAITVTKGVLCGTATEGLFPITVMVDDSPAWPTYQTKVNASYTGATGTSTADGDECTVHLDRWVLVKGLSAEYSDTTVMMPTAEQGAAPGSPGWEDWDSDGQPGITQRISGTLTGSLYVALRFTTELTGSVDPSAASFQLPISWTLEQSTLGVNGSPVLAVQGSPEGNPSGQFAEFARLPAQYIVDDVATTCDNVHDLTSTLTPNAMQ